MNQQLDVESAEQIRLRRQDPNQSLIFDWLSKMVAIDNPIREISALFWHHHIPCAKGNDHNQHSRLALEIYREYGLQDFRTLLIKISANPAMMYWLDGHHSHKNNPNENFPRELMELYTLGEGHYTIQDVKEASRAFTGRRFDHINYPYAMYIDMNAFDNNYKTILGQTGNWDGDDVIDIILSQKQTAKHISKSALIFFLGRIPSEHIVNECAKVYFESGYIFETLLKHIFFSSWFFDSQYKVNKVKTPVELIVGLQRRTGMRCVGIKTINYFLRDCGQKIFKPPSVAGWPVGEEWLVGEELVNRVLLPAAFLRIANRTSKRTSFIYKVLSRIEHRNLRQIRYTFDCNFDEIFFSNSLGNSGIEARSWMNNDKIISNKLSDILTHPRHQYS
tara:strand:+ start:2645 stop:3817 length:1173 start_codon:yes stop_codon:yes gene_type:complete